MPQSPTTQTLPVDPEEVVDRLAAMQRRVRDLVIESRRGKGPLHDVSHTTEADTIYAIDAVVEPAIEEMCREWARTTPLVLIAEGIEGDGGVEGFKTFPEGSREEDALIRLIIDPIDGTRGIMYDKRAAWALAGVAPNKGPGTRLRDIEVAVMTELPTSKMAFGDVLWAIKGRGAHGRRESLTGGSDHPLRPSPSGEDNLLHGFSSVVSFFPGTKVLAAELMEHLVEKLVGKADVTRAVVFDDQYASTGGQWFELAMGRDRFTADLRPAFYAAQGQPEGLCCHPYDCACLLVAEEAGAIITDAAGRPLDGPLDVTTGLSWVGYANPKLRAKIEPLLQKFLRDRDALR